MAEGGAAEEVCSALGGGASAGVCLKECLHLIPAFFRDEGGCGCVDPFMLGFRDPVSPLACALGVVGAP